MDYMIREVLAEGQKYEVLHGNCMDVLKRLPEQSVQCVVTSPPYFGLRSYLKDDDENKPYEIGFGQSMNDYIESLVQVFREVRRVLRDDGVVFLNLGDSYNGSGGAGGDYDKGGIKEGQPKYPGRNIPTLKPKDLCMIPARVAIALQDAGWWLRQDIIWHKPNPMPESVTDRCTKSHEYIFLLTKSARYFYDHEAVREPNSGELPYGDKREFKMNHEQSQGRHGKSSMFSGGSKQEYIEKYYTNGRNRRSVWTVTTKPYSGAHFATMPPDLVEPCILAGTSARGCCPHCGTPWVRVTERNNPPTSGSTASQYAKGTTANRLAMKRQAAREQGEEFTNRVRTVGWRATCACPAHDPIPCIVLDPFTGSGTTGMVALQLGRRFIGIELNSDYIQLAHKRIGSVQPTLFGG